MMDNVNHHYRWPYGHDEDGAQGSQPCQQMDLFCSSEEPLDVAAWLSFFEDDGKAEGRGLGSAGSSFSLDSFRQVEEEIAEELRRHHGKADEEVSAFVAAEPLLLPSQSCVTTAYSEDDPPRREVTATPPPSLPLPLPTFSTTQEESGKEPVKQGVEEEEEEVKIVSVVHKHENSPSPFGLLFQRTTPARQRPPLSLAKRTPNKDASSRIASSTTSSFSRIGSLPPSSTTISSCEASSGPLSKVLLSKGKDVAKVEKPIPSHSTADTHTAPERPSTETTASPKAATTPTPSSSPSPTKQKKRKKKQWGGFLDTSSSSSEEWEGEERAFSNGSSPVKEEDNTRQHVATLLPFDKTREEAAGEERNGDQKERGNSFKRKIERVFNLLAEPSSPDAIATRHNSDNDDNMWNDNPVASQHKKRRIQVSEQDPMALVVQGHLSQDEKYAEEEQKKEEAEEPVKEVVTKRRRGRPKGSGKKRTSRGRPPKHRASVVEPSAETEPPKKEDSKASNNRLTIRITRNSKRMEEDDLPSKSSREERNEAMTMQSPLTEQQHNEPSKKIHPAQEEIDSRKGDEGDEEEFIELDKFVEPFDEQSVKEWSSARIAAWRQRHSNPNAYYYRFTDIGVKQAAGGIKGAEAKAWMDRYNEFKSKGWQVGSSWGLFSKGLPHRVGYQCANYYRKLVRERKLPNEKANAASSKRTNNEIDEDTRQCSAGYRGSHSKDMQLKNCLTDVWQTQQVKYVEKWVDRWLRKYHVGEGDITFTTSSVSPQRSKRETEHSTIASQPISPISPINTSHVHKQEKKKSKDNEKENEKRTPLNKSKTNDALLLLERKEQRLATKANKKTEPLPLSPPQQPPKLETKAIKTIQPERNKKQLISSSPLLRSKQTAPITRQLDLSFWIKGLAPLPQEEQPPEKVAMPKRIPSTWARLIQPLQRDHKGRTALQRRYEDIKGAFYQEMKLSEPYDLKLLGNDFEAVVMDPPWANQETWGVTPEELGRWWDIGSLVRNGLLFIWVEKELIPRVMRMAAKWGFTYVENLAWVRQSVNNKTVEEPSPYFRKSKLTLLIFKKMPSSLNGVVGSSDNDDDDEEETAIGDLELRHQRNTDVIFAPLPPISKERYHRIRPRNSTKQTKKEAFSSKGDEMADEEEDKEEDWVEVEREEKPEAVYDIIETMLPNACYDKARGRGKMLELFCPKGYRRKGWTSVHFY
ncbi:Myb-like domain-containing protein [Balamuthia mandrillaris]